EFSVNLTKLGLDPVTLLGGDICGTPFNRIIIKTRASASFTAELKDFVAPTDLFLAPRAIALTETPFICDDGTNIAEIFVSNPLPTSFYQWTTPDGNIVTSPATGPSIIVDQPGTYIVTHFLTEGCNVYATDTVLVQPFTTCDVLENVVVNFKGAIDGNDAMLDWRGVNNLKVGYFEVERSLDGVNFQSVARVNRKEPAIDDEVYGYKESLTDKAFEYIYYRIKIVSGNKIKYSNIVTIMIEPVMKTKVTVFPNPVRDMAMLQVSASRNGLMKAEVYDATGKRVRSASYFVRMGGNVVSLGDFQQLPDGVYFVSILIDDELIKQTMLISRKKAK
ncbi:MAG TPA: T9SS type A sorting domain-containing protein, partial [Chitinophagaceae bacterium]|nr:T9SS type A sorting domain-containing protein [Chitinophagaceae bacterium]